VVHAFVVGGHGYVGCRVMAAAEADGDDPVVVSRSGDTRRGTSSIAWADLERVLRGTAGAVSVVWLLDGAKDEEPRRLRSLVDWAASARLSEPSQSAHVVLVSTCTVYGDRGGGECTEDTPLDLVSEHARVKAECEQILAGSRLSWCVQRLGALYGIDDRRVRADRVQTWVTQARNEGVVRVPDPAHWRGWLHRDQAARALWRAARDRTVGTFNVASANLRFGDAVALAAAAFGARVVGADKPDPCNYRVDAGRARALDLLDERPGENLAATIRAFVGSLSPTGDAG
jgi:nucleoside-diphosphate-sugar epimerase